MHLTGHSEKCQAHSKSSKMVLTYLFACLFVFTRVGGGEEREKQVDRQVGVVMAGHDFTPLALIFPVLSSLCFRPLQYHFVQTLTFCMSGNFCLCHFPFWGKQCIKFLRYRTWMIVFRAKCYFYIYFFTLYHLIHPVTPGRKWIITMFRCEKRLRG